MRVSVDHFYITLFSALEQTLHSNMIPHSAFLNIHRRGALTALVPRETAAVLANSVYTIQPCTMSLHAKPHT